MIIESFFCPVQKNLSNPLNFEVDTSSILSFSIECTNIVVITRDYQAKVIGSKRICENLVAQPDSNSSRLDQFIDFEIKDEEGHILFPISAYIMHDCIIFIVLK